MTMLKFYKSRLSDPKPCKGSKDCAGPGLIVTIGPDNESWMVDLEIEDLSGATRDHSGTDAHVSLLHMMCQTGSVDQQDTIRLEIQNDPGSFYGGVYAQNRSYD